MIARGIGHDRNMPRGDSGELITRLDSVLSESGHAVWGLAPRPQTAPAG